MVKSTNRENVQYVIVSPDGGWGWVVVLAAFYCNLVVNGCLLSFSVYLPAIVKTHQVNNATISFVSSLAYGIHFGFGPVCAAFCTCYGFRVTVFLGSLITTISTASAVLRPPFWALIFMLGIFRGVGLCFMYMPTILATNMYFSRYKVHAIGIVMCSTGAGAAIFAYAGHLLLLNVRWETAHAFLALTAFLGCIAAFAFKPLTPVRIATSVHIDPNKIESLTYSNYENDDDVNTDNKTILFVARKRLRPTLIAPIDETDLMMDYAHDIHKRERIFFKWLSCASCIKKKKTSIALMHPDTREEILEAHSRKTQHREFRVFQLRPIVRLGNCQKLKKSLVESMSCQILKNWKFCIYCLSGSLANAAIIIVFTFEKDRILSLGFNEQAAVMLIAISGLANMFWRLLLGTITMIPYVNYRTLNVIGTCLGGVALMTVNLSGFFYHQLMYCIVLGFGLACFVVFRPVQLLEIVERKDVANCVGLSMLYSGIFSIIGPPFGGWLLVLVQDYQAISLLSGMLFFLAGISLIPLISTKNIVRGQQIS